jgi:quaternary ammonium compound-resistance protein SugE
MSGWAWLGIAGVAEVAWSQSIRPTEGFTRPLPTLVCVVLMLAAVYPLTRAMESIPVGTAYVVFTGIGAAGAVILGVLVAGDPVAAGRMLGLGLIVAGVVTLRAVSAG